MIKKIVAIFFTGMIVIIVIIPAIISSIGGKVQQEEAAVYYDGPEIRMLVSETGEVITMPLEQYLVGVIAGEMPAAFELEALKAQAVAARTYTLKRIGQSNDEHPNADICDDPNHSQAWLSDKAMQARWGASGYAAFKRKIQQAINETRGLILTYDNRLIEPVYHSTSGPRTENSEDVWQTAIPYLRSVECTWGTESPRYQEKKVFTWEQLDRLLGTSFQALPASTRTASQGTLQIISETATGRASELLVGREIIAATEIRRILGLNSTSMELEKSEKGVTFTTTGFGHGVGMSQYGANGMAKEGRSFVDILTHYYTGINVMKLPGY